MWNLYLPFYHRFNWYPTSTSISFEKFFVLLLGLKVGGLVPDRGR